MAKLENLQDDIDGGKTAILSLSHDHAGNAEGVDLTVNIFKSSTFGKYCRILRKKGYPSPMRPYPNYYWNELFFDKNSIEVTSDTWVPVDESHDQ